MVEAVIWKTVFVLLNYQDNVKKRIKGVRSREKTNLGFKKTIQNMIFETGIHQR